MDLQGNPDDFDIDGYLASRPSQVFWLVTRYASEMAPGDRVYLWRNQGQAKAVAGIIAETIVSEAPRFAVKTRKVFRFGARPLRGAALHKFVWSTV